MKSGGGSLHVRLVSGRARWKRGTGTLQNMQIGDQIEGGGREMGPAQAAEGRSVGNRGRLLNWEAALLPGWSLSLHSRSVEHRRRAEGCVNAGSKQNDRQHKRSGRQQLER